MKTTNIASILLENESINKIMTIFSDNNVEARFVGGCVRDLILNKPINDVDISTPLHPEKVIELLELNGIKTMPTGLQHGTITAIYKSYHVEITTLRRDVTCDGRHAEVEFTDDWKQDAARRDFTMNALSCSVDGTIHDYFDGLSDLKNGVIRFVGNADNRIKEDALRILRLFRFSGRYNLIITNDALDACTRNAHTIKVLSGERIQSEMFR